METINKPTTGVKITPASERIDTRTGIFSRLKTIKLLTWFFDILLNNISEKCIANLYREGNNTMLSILMDNTHIHISITELDKVEVPNDNN